MRESTKQNTYMKKKIIEINKNQGGGEKRKKRNGRWN